MLRLSYLCVLLSLPVTAATHFIRQGGSGANDGTWTGAFPDVPASLVRGDTYYIAAGTYARSGAWILADTYAGPCNASQLITIKSATIADHFTASGWSDTFAGVSTISNRVEIETPCYTFNGQSSTDITTGHGLFVNIGLFSGHTSCATFGNCIGITFGGGGVQVTNITLQYVEIKGQWTTGVAGPELGIYGTGPAGQPMTNITMQHVSCHDLASGTTLTGGSGCIQSDNWNTVLWEYGYMARISSRQCGTGQTCGHNEGWANDRGIDWTFRNSVFEDIEGTAALVAGIDGTTTTDQVKIYGNVFRYLSGNPGGFTGTGNGVITCLAGGSAGPVHCTNWQIYNNTIVGWGGGGGCGIWFEAEGPNSALVENNLWYDPGTGTGNACSLNANMQIVNPTALTTPVANTTVDYNTYLRVSPQSDTGLHTFTIAAPATTPFTNWTLTPVGNYTLTSETVLAHLNDGLTLSSPFNVDPASATRGADNTWERGAYEFSTTCTITPSSLGPWTLQQPINITFTNAGCGAGPWSTTGAFPPGVTFNTANGVLSGTVSSNAGSPYTPSVTWANGASPVTNSYSITVNALPTITTSSPLPNGTQGQTYAQTLVTSGGTGTITCSQTAGSLTGSGLALQLNCTVSGNASTPGLYSFTVTPTDTNNVAGTAKAFQVSVVSATTLGGHSQGGSVVMGGSLTVN